MKPRPYQLDGVDRVRAAIARGIALILFVLPTGGGKTVVASHIIVCALALERRVLFVAHRTELVKQAFAKLLRSGVPPQEIGLIKAGVPTAKNPGDGGGPVDLGASDNVLWERHARRRPTARVYVGSIQTLRSSPTRKPAEIDLVIVDEAHHATADSYRLLREWYPPASDEHPNGTVHIGLTATPCRGDGAGLREVYDELIEVASIQQLIEWKFLVAPRAWTVPLKSLPDLRDVKLIGGDYQLDQLNEAVTKSALVGDIVDHWLRRGRGARTIVFAVSVEHSKMICERFVAAGVKAEHLDGKTDDDERAAILERLASGETKVVSNCMVLTEGFDCPAVKTLILARPTQSYGLYLQMAGRILRPWEDEPAVILDHAGSVASMGLPQWVGGWSLDAPKRARRGAKEDCAKVCKNPDCMEVLELGVTVCPHCGMEQPAREVRPPNEGAGELVEMTEASYQELLVRWSELLDEWRKENARRMKQAFGDPSTPPPRKNGWIKHEWRKRTKMATIPRGTRLPTLTSAELDRIKVCELRSAEAKHGPAVVTLSRRLASELEDVEIFGADGQPVSRRRVEGWR